ncbi:MAG: ankyrin repeat domain-containing protein [Nitrosomonas sp.]|nr:ankyrin repeat domain-containing protein [Nitrosomonas sp.]
MSLSCHACTLPARVACGNSCGAMYCSQVCADGDWQKKHNLVCIAGQEKRDRDDDSNGEPSVDDLIITLKTLRSLQKDEDTEVIKDLAKKLLERMNNENAYAIRKALSGLKKVLRKLLVSAITGTNVENVLLLLTDGIGFDVNYFEEKSNQQPLIMYALDMLSSENNDNTIKEKAFKIFELFLKHPDLNVNAQEDGEGWCALSDAVAKSKQTYCEKAALLLLKHPNIDVNMTILSGFSILMLAVVDTVKNVSEAVVHALLQHKNINVNFKKNDGWTALTIAVAKLGSKTTPNTVKMLLEHPEIDVNLQNNIGKTPLMLCLNQLNNSALVVSDDVFLMFIRHPNIDFFIKDFAGLIASDYADKKKHKLMIFARIAMQKITNKEGREVYLPKEISRNISLRRIRDHVCKSISNNGNLDDLKALADMLYCPYDANVSKQELCLMLSDVLALGNEYDRQKAKDYEGRKRMRKNTLKNALSFIESFKKAAADYGQIDVNGKTVEQIVQEVNLFLE